MTTKLERVISSWQRVGGDAFKPYLRPSDTNSKYPPLTTDALSVDLFVGEKRNVLKSPTAGDASLLLGYRGREAYVSSVKEQNDDLEVVQLQGAKQEGYRVTQGMYVAIFIADQVRLLATQPDSMFRRITMLHPLTLSENLSSVPSPTAILRIPSVVERYQSMINRLKMEYSSEEAKYVLELPIAR